MLSSDAYNKDARKRIREELGIQDKVVVGHVGRFVYQKNHDFILEAFAEFHKHCLNSVLLLVGEGELLQSIQDKAKKYENCRFCDFLWCDV